MSDMKAQELLVDQYVEENRTDEAVKLLFEMILSSVEKKDFKKAEALHEKLYEVDPMALTEIVRASDVIEEAKNRGVDPAHREIWAHLYDRLSINEGNALYYSMENTAFSPGDVIIQQGQFSTRLFFINKGEVKAVFSRENKDGLLATLKGGEFFGNEQFFSATVSTVSMIAQGHVQVSSLDKDVVKKWKTDAPALESKLFDYCGKHDIIKKAIGEKRMERREYDRVQLSVKMLFQFFDTSGKLGDKAYKGDLSDISEGGLSFLIKTSKPESIRMMLGRRIAVSFSVKTTSGKSRTVERHGQITAVQTQIFDDVSIHMKFDTPLEKGLIESLG